MPRPRESTNVFPKALCQAPATVPHAYVSGEGARRDVRKGPSSPPRDSSPEARGARVQGCGGQLDRGLCSPGFGLGPDSAGCSLPGVVGEGRRERVGLAEFGIGRPDLGRSPRVPVRTQNFLRLPAWSLGKASEPKLNLWPLWSCFLLHLESPRCEYRSVLAPPLRGPLLSVETSSKLSWVPNPVTLGLQGQAIHQTEDANLEGGK